MKGLAALAWVLVSHLSFAEARAPSTFSLDQARSAMRDGNLKLRAGKSDDLAASEAVHAAGRWQNPQVDVDYFNGIHKSSYDKFGAATVGVSQLIETSGAPTSKREAAKYEEAATRADNRATAARLALDVEQAYVALAAQAQVIETYTKLAEALREAERVIMARLAAGTTSPYAAQRITLARGEALAALAAAETDLVNLRNALDRAVGPMSTRLVGTPVYPTESREPLPSLATLVDRQQRQRYDLVAARQRAKESHANVLTVKRSVFRGIAVRVAAGFGQGPGQIDLGVGMSVPLPVVDAGGPTIRGAEHAAVSASLSADALAAEAEHDVAAAYLTVIQRRKAADDYAVRTREPSEKIVHEAEAGFREARLSVLDLVDAYRTAHETVASRIRLSRDAVIAEIDLRRAVVCGR